MNISFEQQCQLLTVLQGPRLTEKAVRETDRNRCVIFEVARKVDKRLIQQAVEWVFKVKVDVVRVANVKGKPRRFKQTSGRHNHWKKAYITLKPGYNIDLTS